MLSLLFLLSCSASVIPTQGVIPAVALIGPVTVQYTSIPGTFDGSKVSFVNDTSFDWWWFDTLSPDLYTSLVIVFFTATCDSFPLVKSAPGALQMVISAKLPNGTLITSGAVAVEATIASSGVFGEGVKRNDDGFTETFRVAPDLSISTVDVKYCSFSGRVERISEHEESKLFELHGSCLWNPIR
jgi:hypothetical protein